MTVSGAAVAFCGLVLTRNRCPSLVTAYTWLVLITPAGNNVCGNRAVATSAVSIGTAVIAPSKAR